MSLQSIIRRRVIPIPSIELKFKGLPDAFQDSTCEARINRKRWPIASWIWAGEVVVSGEVRVSGWQRSTALCLSKYRKKCASFGSHPALSSPPGISYTSPKRCVRIRYMLNDSPVYPSFYTFVSFVFYIDIESHREMIFQRTRIR